MTLTPFGQRLRQCLEHITRIDQTPTTIHHTRRAFHDQPLPEGGKLGIGVQSLFPEDSVRQGLGRVYTLVEVRTARPWTGLAFLFNVSPTVAFRLLPLFQMGNLPVS